MSQFAFPRLHFRGQFSTNVGTANNDDLGSPQFVDSAHVRVDTLGKTDAEFALWLREIEPGFGIRGGWNVYGDGRCGFLNTTCHAAEPVAGTLATTAAMDPVVATSIRLVNAYMVDQDPEGTTSTQIFAAEFRLSGAGGLSIVGNPSRAVSRWVARRNLGVTGFRAFAAVWHSVIRPDQLTIVPGASASLLALKAAQDAGQGLFVRYCTYLLAPQIPAAQLAADFAAGHATTNPAIGKVLGTIGVWQPGTMTTVAEGRRLVSGGIATSDHVDFRFNPATVYVDTSSHRISVDLINSIPEVNENLEKVNLGPLDLTLTSTTGGATTSTVLGTIANTRADYEQRSGIADFDIPIAVWTEIATGRLDLVQRSSGSPLLVEVPLILETDERAIYLQQGGVTENLVLRGWLQAQPAANLRINVHQFSTTDKSFAPVPPATAIVACPDHVDLDADGRASIVLQGVNPGCCTLRFTADDNLPTDYFACVRVLPADDFSTVPDNQLTFEYIYENVLKYYHLLHPAMDGHINLAAQDDVEIGADRIRTRIKNTAWDDPKYMPVTRDLSAGKTALLLRWCDIVSPVG